MEERIGIAHASNFPIWCWVKCGRSTCPPRHKGAPAKGFEVKITFHKPESEILITDFRRYSFVMNNLYMPDSMADKARFDTANLAADERQRQICASLVRCITGSSDVLQGCAWDVKLTEVERVEMLPNDGYCYGSLNDARADGTRRDWQREFYRLIENSRND